MIFAYQRSSISQGVEVWPVSKEAKALDLGKYLVDGRHFGIFLEETEADGALGPIRLKTMDPVVLAPAELTQPGLAHILQTAVSETGFYKTKTAVTVSTPTHSGDLFLTFKSGGPLEIFNADVNFLKGYKNAVVVSRYSDNDEDRVDLPQDFKPFKMTKDELVDHFWTTINPRLHDRFLNGEEDEHMQREEIQFVQGDLETLTLWTERLVGLWLADNPQIKDSLETPCTVSYYAKSENRDAGFRFENSQNLDQAPYSLIKALTKLGQEQLFTGSETDYNDGYDSRVSGYTRWPESVLVKVTGGTTAHETLALIDNDARKAVREWMAERGFGSDDIAALIGK
jgi:hypothetical protein